MLIAKKIPLGIKKAYFSKCIKIVNLLIYLLTYFFPTIWHIIHLSRKKNTIQAIEWTTSRLRTQRPPGRPVLAKTGTSECPQFTFLAWFCQQQGPRFADILTTLDPLLLPPLLHRAGTEGVNPPLAGGVKVPGTKLLIQSGGWYAQLGTHKDPGRVWGPSRGQAALPLRAINCGWHCVNTWVNRRCRCWTHYLLDTVSMVLFTPRFPLNVLFFGVSVTQKRQLKDKLRRLMLISNIGWYLCVCWEASFKGDPKEGVKKKKKKKSQWLDQLFVRPGITWLLQIRELVKIAASTCKRHGIQQMKARWGTLKWKGSASDLTFSCLKSSLCPCLFFILARLGQTGTCEKYGRRCIEQSSDLKCLVIWVLKLTMFHLEIWRHQQSD